MAFKGRTTDKFVVPGTESQRAQDLLQEKFPIAAGASARVVFAAPEGEKLTDPENRAAVTASLEEAQGAKEVSTVTDPYESKAMTEDRRIGFADVYYPVPADEIDDAARDELAETAAPARDAGLQVEFGGNIVTEESEAGSEEHMSIRWARFITTAVVRGARPDDARPRMGMMVGLRTAARSRRRRPSAGRTTC